MTKKDKKNTTYWVIAIIVIVVIAILLYYSPKMASEEAGGETTEDVTEEVTEESMPQYSEAEGYIWGIDCDPASGELSFMVTNAGDFKLNLYHGEIPAVQPLMKVSVNGRTIKEDVCDKYVLEAGATAKCNFKPAVLRMAEADYDQYGLNNILAISVEAKEKETFKCE